jgi:hypothetical protein
MAPMRFSRIKIEGHFRELEKMTVAVARREDSGTRGMPCAGSGQISGAPPAVTMRGFARSSLESDK